MEKFGYNKGWKRAKIVACLYPIIFLLGVAAYWVLLVLPGDAEFKWWVPLFVIALFVWAFTEIAKFKKTLDYSVELSEDSIRIGGNETSWCDVLRIEFRGGHWNQPAIILHTKAGNILAIAGATDSIQYVKGFIEGHVKQAMSS